VPLSERNTGVQVYNGYISYDPSGRPAPPAERLLHHGKAGSSMWATSRPIRTITWKQVALGRTSTCQLSYDRGGKFTGDLRAIYATASQLHMGATLQYGDLGRYDLAERNRPTPCPPPVPPATYAYVVPGGLRASSTRLVSRPTPFRPPSL